ncbi:MAG: hypothetical protein AAFV01_17815, partial [Bacteroidota bacterium]
MLLLSRFSRRCAALCDPAKRCRKLRGADRRSAAARLDCLEVASAADGGGANANQLSIGVVGGEIDSTAAAASFGGVSEKTPALYRGEFSRRRRDGKSAQNCIRRSPAARLDCLDVASAADGGGANADQLSIGVVGGEIDSTAAAA